MPELESGRRVDGGRTHIYLHVVLKDRHLSGSAQPELF